MKISTFKNRSPVSTNKAQFSPNQTQVTSLRQMYDQRYQAAKTGSEVESRERTRLSNKTYLGDIIATSLINTGAGYLQDQITASKKKKQEEIEAGEKTDSLHYAGIAKNAIANHLTTYQSDPTKFATVDPKTGVETFDFTIMENSQKQIIQDTRSQLEAAYAGKPNLKTVLANYDGLVAPYAQSSLDSLKKSQHEAHKAAHAKRIAEGLANAASDSEAEDLIDAARGLGEFSEDDLLGMKRESDGIREIKKWNSAVLKIADGLKDTNGVPVSNAVLNEQLNGVRAAIHGAKSDGSISLASDNELGALLARLNVIEDRHKIIVKEYQRNNLYKKLSSGSVPTYHEDTLELYGDKVDAVLQQDFFEKLQGKPNSLSKARGDAAVDRLTNAIKLNIVQDTAEYQDWLKDNIDEFKDKGAWERETAFVQEQSMLYSRNNTNIGEITTAANIKKDKVIAADLRNASSILNLITYELAADSPLAQIVDELGITDRAFANSLKASKQQSTSAINQYISQVVQGEVKYSPNGVMAALVASMKEMPIHPSLADMPGVDQLNNTNWRDISDRIKKARAKVAVAVINPEEQSVRGRKRDMYDNQLLLVARYEKYKSMIENSPVLKALIGEGD